MSNLSVCHVQHVYYNNRRTTSFQVFALKGGAWGYEGAYTCGGWFTRHSALLIKAGL